MPTKKGPLISFSDDDYPKGFDHHHDDPMVITTTICNYIVKRILVYQESSIDILYNVATTNMNIQKGIKALSWEFDWVLWKTSVYQRHIEVESYSQNVAINCEYGCWISCCQHLAYNV